MSIQSVVIYNHLIICPPLLLLSSIFSSIRVFSNESVLYVRRPKYCASASASALSMNIQDWFPLGLTGLISLKSKGLSRVFSNTKSISSKTSVLLHSAFFIVQLSHPYVTTGKTIALTRQTFIGQVMSLLFNMLSRLVIAFLQRSTCILIPWLQSPSAVILEPPKNKVLTVSIIFPSIWHRVMDMQMTPPLWQKLKRN